MPTCVDTNGNWYLAGESVSFKKIVRLWVTPEMVNYTLGPESVQSSNNNGYLKLNIAYSPTPFAGVITARFIHEVYTPASGWRIFDETVTWY